MIKKLLIRHMAALTAGCILDLAVGDPHGFPHPVAGIGRLITFLEGKLRGPGLPRGTLRGSELLRGTLRGPAAEKDRLAESRREFAGGLGLCAAVLTCTVLLTGLILALAYRLHPAAGFAAEAVLTCTILAARSLSAESRKVWADLESGDLDRARGDLSMIVGRDTRRLDRAGVIRAGVETVAENTSDGVIAPLVWTALGGPVAGMAYKAVNTMDSMVGYRNERYEHFGRPAAKLDDAVNLLPSRVSALLMILAAALCRLFSPVYDPAAAFRIWKRDRRNHKSPNSAQTESACAGALGLRLGGDAYYQGILVRKPFIGDAVREPEPEDIRRAGRLMFVTEGLAWLALAAAGGAFLLLA